MKIKSDFVTNSSSASFIMYFKPKNPHTSLEEFTTSFNDYLRYFQKENGDLRYWNGSDIKVDKKDGEEVFSITELTSMYNGKEDVPLYMRELMQEYFLHEYSYLFTVHSFEVIEDN